MVRKRCRHGKGLAGSVARRAWRTCGCAWGVDLVVEGRRVWHNLGVDEHEARVRELRLRADLAEGRRPARAPGHGVTELVKDWIAHQEARGAKTGSLAAWRVRGEHLKRYFGDVPIENVKLPHLQRMVEDLSRAELANATVNGVLAAFGAVVNHARLECHIDVAAVDMRGVRLPVSQRTDHLTVAECHLVIAAAPQPWASMMEVALLTGLREGELLALTAEDVERDRPIMHVRRTLTQARVTNTPKTRAGARAVTLSPRAHEVLLERAARGGRLWDGSLSDAGKALRASLDALGLHRKGRGWHSFRHAHTALLNEAGVSLRDAASRLGHGANTAQSMQYGWAAEHTDAVVIDEALTRHVPSP